MFKAKPEIQQGNLFLEIVATVIRALFYAGLSEVLHTKNLCSIQYLVLIILVASSTNHSSIFKLNIDIVNSLLGRGRRKKII